MNHKILWPQMSALTLVILLVVACGSPQPTPTITPVLPTPTTAATPAPTTTPTTVEADLEVGTSWDYVALGDSIPAGYGVRGQSYVIYYAEYIEADLGVTVTVNNWAVSGQTTEVLLTTLQYNQELRDAISEAEVITIWTGWNDIFHLIHWGPDSKCGSGENLDLDCVREGVRALEANIDAILAEILSLRSTDDALIRIADNCNFLVGKWKETGTFQMLKEPGFEDWSHAIVQAASRHNVPVVHTYTVLNGPNGDEEIAAEYLQHDGLHFTAEGHILCADLTFIGSSGTNTLVRSSQG